MRLKAMANMRRRRMPRRTRRPRSRMWKGLGVALARARHAEEHAHRVKESVEAPSGNDGGGGEVARAGKKLLRPRKREPAPWAMRR